MSKMTLGQRKFPTLGQRSTLPKSYVGPTLSCYLGRPNCAEGNAMSWLLYMNFPKYVDSNCTRYLAD